MQKDKKRNEKLRWPPRPGEVWIADSEWPTFGFKGNEGSEILVNDIFLITETGKIYSDASDEHQKELVDLHVVIRGQSRFITSELFSGVPDMHKLEYDDDVF